ncbi:MAG: hypothetical protein QOF76_681 [Solirubrobacteraceae bacterium]|jgi:hypothetical protein|nr:hypothetical protein [Solirubrobacteraceae bacterium]
MDEAAFAAGTPEVELDRRDGMPMYLEGEKNDMGDLTLTNDRILFVSNKAGPTGNLIGDLIGSALQGDQKKHEIAHLTDLRGGGIQSRRLIPDLYELTLADGRSLRIHRKLYEKWDSTIRRALAERHGVTVTEDGDAWRAG